MSDLSRSLVDAAAEALAREGEVYAEHIGLDPFQVSWQRLSEDERAELRASARFAVAAVLETLAATAPYDEDGGFELWHPPALRGLAAEVKGEEGR